MEGRRKRDLRPVSRVCNTPPAARTAMLSRCSGARAAGASVDAFAEVYFCRRVEMENTLSASARRLLRLFTISSLLLLTAFGQGQTGQITGVVTDSSGASVPGAKVVVINEGTAISKSTATTACGNYTVP
jgi:hypothetical protein